jgi:hypothetical protein
MLYAARAVCIAVLLFAQSQPKTARQYFQELKTAGAFTDTVKTTSNEKIEVKDSHLYVCFDDDDTSPGFFTFTTIAYDKLYADAIKVLTDRNATANQRQSALATMNTLQDREPYLAFFGDDMVSLLPDYVVKKGVQQLELSVYLRGVNVGRSDFIRTPTAPNTVSGPWHRQDKATLSIEPKTNRYVLITTKVSSGQCEKLHAEGKPTPK